MTRPRGPYRNCRFCPKCGVESLDKDRYMEAKNCPYAEYICGVCGFGFRLVPSRRVAVAEEYFREDRKVRLGKFQDGVSEENKQKWCAMYPHGEDVKSFWARMKQWARVAE